MFQISGSQVFTRFASSSKPPWWGLSPTALLLNPTLIPTVANTTGTETFSTLTSTLTIPNIRKNCAWAKLGT